MSLDTRYPAIADLRARARRRIPHFMWAYLDTGTGSEAGIARNRAAFDEVLFWPQVLRGSDAPDLAVELLGRRQALPLGIAPVGQSGGIWPGAEAALARCAVEAGIPYCLSTMATQGPEDLAPHIGDEGWYQLYPPRDAGIRADMLRRIREAGFRVLVLTIDVPVSSRRERQVKGGLTTPPKLTPRLLAQVALRPAWALGILRHGMPRLPSIDRYAPEQKGSLPSTAHIGYLLRIAPDWSYLEELRQEWDGPLVVKGVLLGEDAARIKALGADAVWVSNHAARQFDGAPPALASVAPVRAAVGPGYPVLYDSGIEGGLDILRAIALGADFCFLGKAFHYALGALGEVGPAHLVRILAADLTANLGQLAARRPEDVRAALVRSGPDKA